MKILIAILLFSSLCFSQRAVDVDLSKLNIETSNGGEFSQASLNAKQEIINKTLKKIIAFFSTRVDLKEKYKGVSFSEVVNIAKTARFTVVGDSYVNEKNKEIYIKESELNEVTSSESGIYDFCINRILNLISENKAKKDRKSIAYLIATGKSGYESNMKKGDVQICSSIKNEFSYLTCIEIVETNYFNTKVVDELVKRATSGIGLYLFLEQLSNLDISDKKLENCKKEKDFNLCVLENRKRI